MKRENGIDPPAPALPPRMISCWMRLRRDALWASASASGGGKVDIMNSIAVAREPPMTAAQPVMLVTGAARRIGAAIARRLHADGCAVALHYNASAAEAQALAAELEAVRPGSAHVVQADLARFDALAELVAATVGHFGRLDGLVNNASAFFPTPAGTVTPAQWD